VILLQIPERRHSVDVAVIGLRGGALELHEVSTTVLPVAAAQVASEYVAESQPDGAAGKVHTLTLPGSIPNTVLVVGLAWVFGMNKRYKGPIRQVEFDEGMGIVEERPVEPEPPPPPATPTS